MSATEQLDWNPLGREWWEEAGRMSSASPEQVAFALCRSKSMNATASARAAGYATAGDSANARQAGHRAAHSTAVLAMLSLYAAETGTTDTSVVDTKEGKAILSRIARQAAANERIRAVEALAKLDAMERELRIKETESEPGDWRQTLREIAQLSPRVARVICEENKLNPDDYLGPQPVVDGATQ
jgi:hypothetical protein